MRLYECLNLPQGFASALKCLLYTFFVVIDINMDLAIILFVCMSIDMFFGLIKAIVLNEEISFRKFIIGFLSKLMFLTIPLIVAVLGLSLGYHLKIFADFAIRVLLANECLSILANIMSVKKKENVKNVDLVSIFIKFIQDKAVSFINNYLNQK